MPREIYKFENQNLVTSEDNLKYMGDLPFVAYFDFKTTTGNELKNSKEYKEMCPVWYSLVFAFYPKLDIERQMFSAWFESIKLYKLPEK